MEKNTTTTNDQKKCLYCGNDYLITAIVPGLPGGSCCLDAHTKAWQRYMANLFKKGIKASYEVGLSKQIKEVFPAWYKDSDEEE